METNRPDAETAAPTWCCDEFGSAVDVTFAMPVNGPTGWLLYGTDAETVSGGLPELRYWAVQYCPFCGARLQLFPGDLPRGRAFGFRGEMMDTDERQKTGDMNGERQGSANT